MVILANVVVREYMRADSKFVLYLVLQTESVKKNGASTSWREWSRLAANCRPPRKTNGTRVFIRLVASEKMSNRSTKVLLSASNDEVKVGTSK